MQQNTKQFAEELSKALDELGMPPNPRERAVILSKMLHIPKQNAWALLEGHLLPDNDLLQKISVELEMDVSFFLKK